MLQNIWHAEDLIEINMNVDDNASDIFQWQVSKVHCIVRNNE